jgi:DnaD/phage-associated family protein
LGQQWIWFNLNAKQQLLAWLDDSSFLEPKEVIIKAMKIACANNKRNLNYVVVILKNWENECLLTVDVIDTYQKNLRPLQNNQQTTRTPLSGRYIPSGFELDLTAGED